MNSVLPVTICSIIYIPETEFENCDKNSSAGGSPGMNTIEGCNATSMESDQFFGSTGSIAISVAEIFESLMVVKPFRSLNYEQVKTQADVLIVE